MEGASESIGKFAQGFQVKTKADDLNSSLSGMNDAMMGTKEVAAMTKDEMAAFFQKMEDEGDNSFSQIFNKEQIEEFKNLNMKA